MVVRPTSRGVRRQSDSFKADATGLLSALCRQIEDWDVAIASKRPDREFVVNLSPITGPETDPATNLNAFEQVVRGVTSFNESRGRELDLYRVGILDVARRDRAGSVSTHSLLVTPLPSKMYRGTLSVSSYQSYAFVRVATSGYVGTGPALYESIYGFLKGLDEAVELRRVDVQFDPLRRLFLNYGPTFSLRWPSAPFPPERLWNGGADEAIADRYSESERH